MFFENYGGDLNYCPLCGSPRPCKVSIYPLDSCPICKNKIFSDELYKIYKFCPKCGVMIPRTQLSRNEDIFIEDIRHN